MVRKSKTVRRQDFEVKLFIDGGLIINTTASTNKQSKINLALSDSYEFVNEWANMAREFKITNVKFHFVPILNNAHAFRGLFAVTQAEIDTTIGYDLSEYVERAMGENVGFLRALHDLRHISLPIQMTSPMKGWQDESAQTETIATANIMTYNHDMGTSLTWGYCYWELTIRFR